MTAIVKPMLAKTYNPDKVVKSTAWTEDEFLIQPKLDGVRCLAMVDTNKNVTYISRSGKPVVPGRRIHVHLRAIIEKACKLIKGPFTFDGELYTHKMPFQDIQSRVSRQDREDPIKDALTYNIYDVYVAMDTTMSFQRRNALLEHLHAYRSDKSKQIEFVPTFWSEAGEELESDMDCVIKGGYEGVMLRNPKSQYHQGRTADLLKYKRFFDEEYRVIDIEEGKGKNKGTAVLVCQVSTSCCRTFTVTAPGNYDYKRRIFEDAHLFIDRLVTVKYQEKTKQGIPRFPVAIGFKEDR